MRRIIFPLAFMFILFGRVCSAPAGDAGWWLEQYPTLTTLKQGCQKKIDEKYMPVGISYQKKGIYVLYFKGFTTKIKSFGLKKYKNLKELQQGVLAMKSIGWAPTGFTRLGNEFLLIYIEAEANWDHFAVINSKADLHDIGIKVRDRTSQGHQPAGITAYGDEFHTLTIAPKGLLMTVWRMREYKSVEELKAGIDEQIKQRYVPMGLSNRNGRIYVMFIKTPKKYCRI